MKLTKSRLKQLIKEELQKVLLEQELDMSDATTNKYPRRGEPGLVDPDDPGMSLATDADLGIANVTFSDEEGHREKESPRQTLRRIAKDHPGGVKAILKLDRNHPDRVAYRNAYKQLRGSKSNRAMAKKDKVRPIKFKEPKLSVQAAEKDYVPVGVSDPQEPTVAAGRGKTQKSHELGSRPTLSNYQPNSLDLDLGGGGLASYLNSSDDEERALAKPSADPRK